MILVKIMSLIKRKEQMTKKKANLGKTLTLVVLGIMVIAFAVLFLYTKDYYRSEVTLEESATETEYNIEEFKGGIFVDGSGNTNAVIFYPGAKVEYTSYLPLCVKLAEQGVDCFLVEMPFHLAILGMNKADSIMDSYDYDNWYLAGHSLGGAMAANYVADNVEDFAGLIMLAAYPTKALVSEDLKVISIYGNKDGILEKEKVDAGKEFVPEHYTEIGLGGANHAGFGNYGPQDGDGEATMEREKQQDMTVTYIMKMIQQTYEEE